MFRFFALEASCVISVFARSGVMHGPSYDRHFRESKGNFTS
jgi:hypothetical protein